MTLFCGLDKYSEISSGLKTPELFDPAKRLVFSEVGSAPSASITPSSNLHLLFMQGERWWKCSADLVQAGVVSDMPGGMSLHVLGWVNRFHLAGGELFLILPPCDMRNV